MPELPEVERYRTFFHRHAAGRTVRSVEADPTIVRNTSAEALAGALRGRTFGPPERHGKWLVAWTDGPALLLHFGMTGDLIWSGQEPERHRHDRLNIGFDDGTEVRYRNMRKLGGAWLAHDAGEVAAILGSLGPDVLGLSSRDVADLLARRRGRAKAALMDQSFVAGIGNLLADEILWVARVDPARRMETLSGDERRRLGKAIRAVIARWVDRPDGEPRPGELLAVRGRPGAACPRCGSALARSVAAGRTTYSCPRCQV